jgi:DNA-3-methyladenine glycosylase
MTFLAADFFARAAVDVARDLLGATLRTRGTDGLWTAGRIVETEAYGGQDDPASHAGRGRTPRSEIMFGPAGLAYVYFIYGVHHCLNFVTEADGTAGAVLIRALEPVEGQMVMARRRGLDLARHRRRDLCAGPGKLCQAMGIDLSWNGTSVVADHESESSSDLRLLLVEAGSAAVDWQSGPRIGISRAVDRPLRFVDPASDCLSR